MKSVEKIVVPNVALASNLDRAQPLNRIEEPVAMISQLDYIKPEGPSAESGVFQEVERVGFQKIGRPKDFAGAGLPDDEPLMK